MGLKTDPKHRKEAVTFERRGGLFLFGPEMKTERDAWQKKRDELMNHVAAVMRVVDYTDAELAKLWLEKAAIERGGDA